MLAGVPLFIWPYIESVPMWVDFLTKLPIGFWTMWVFIMLYDVWMAARQWTLQNLRKESDGKT